MAYPSFGYVKIYPDQVTIVSGDWSLNSDASPQPVRSVNDLQAYFNLRVPNTPTAPNVRRASEQPPASGVYVPFVNTYELSFSPSPIGMEFYTNFPASGGVLEATANLNSADFPIGMALQQLYVYVTGVITFADGRNIALTHFPLKYFGATIRDYIPGAIPVIASTINTNSFMPGAIMTGLLERWSITQAMKTFGFQVPIVAGIVPTSPVADVIIRECYLVGFYNNQQFQFTNDNPDVLPGNISTITSPAAILDNFDVDNLEILWDAQPGDVEDPDFPGFTGGVIIPRSNILIFNSGQITFKMPTELGIPYGGRRLMLVGTGVGAVFFGRYALQNYNITLVDGSGLYALTPNKRNDTYYDRSTVPPIQTVDLRIPDPYVKTGFFNG